MNNQEYEQKRHDSWIRFKTETMFTIDEYAFYAAFDRAYALGKEYFLSSVDGTDRSDDSRQNELLCGPKGESGDTYALGKEKEAVTQEEIEKAAEESSGKRKLAEGSMTAEVYQFGFRDGANFALGKQEKDADTVIQGWVARNGNGPNDLGLRVYTVKPDRRKNRREWNGHGEMSYLIDCRLFTGLTWDSEPQPVEIIIKRKKK